MDNSQHAAIAIALVVIVGIGAYVGQRYYSEKKEGCCASKYLSKEGMSAVDASSRLLRSNAYNRAAGAYNDPQWPANDPVPYKQDDPTIINLEGTNSLFDRTWSNAAFKAEKLLPQINNSSPQWAKDFARENPQVLNANMLETFDPNNATNYTGTCPRRYFSRDIRPLPPIENAEEINDCILFGKAGVDPNLVWECNLRPPLFTLDTYPIGEEPRPA